MSIDRQSYLPLYIQVKEDLKRNITSGLYKEGDMIPSEKELMDSYKVGRATIREAINQLSSERLVEKKQGIGTFVKGQSKSMAFEPFISLEYALKSFGVTTQNIVLQKEIIKNTDTLKDISKMDFAELFSLNRHRCIDGVNVATEEFLFNKEFFDKTQDFDFQQSIGSLIIKELKLDITKFIQEVVIESPDADTQKTLEITAEEQVLIMKRWLYLNNQDTPYQYYKLTVPVKHTAFPFA